MKRPLTDTEWTALQDERQDLMDAIRSLKRADIGLYADFGVELEVELAVVNQRLKPPKGDFAPFSFRAFNHQRWRFWFWRVFADISEKAAAHGAHNY
jgi:hypothetical protein